MEDLNTALFLMINAGPDAPYALILVATGLVNWAVYLFAPGRVLAWVRVGTRLRFAVLDAVLTALVALGVAQIIARLWYDPRPFDLGLGRQLLAQSPETSFPRDHATLLFVLALALVVTPAGRRFGWAVLALAGAVAWSRVYLGVHFPSDMVGALLVAVATTIAMRSIAPPLHNSLYPGLERLYDRILSWLHLPDRWFLRRRENLGDL